MDDNIINQNQNFFIPKDDDEQQGNQDDNNHRDINVHDPYDLILGNVSPVKVSNDEQNDLQASTNVNNEVAMDNIDLHSSVHQSDIGANNDNIDNSKDGFVAQPITNVVDGSNDINTDGNAINFNVSVPSNIEDVQSNTISDTTSQPFIDDTSFHVDSSNTNSGNQGGQDINNNLNSVSSNIGVANNNFVDNDTVVSTQIPNIGNQPIVNQDIPQQNVVPNTLGMQTGGVTDNNVSSQIPNIGNQETINQGIPQNVVSSTVDMQSQGIVDNNVPTDNGQNIYSGVNIDQNVTSQIPENVNVEESIIGIISYVIGINVVTLIISFIKNDKFIKFHSLQSIFFNILFLIIFFIFDFLSHGFLSLGFLIANVVLFIIWILLSIFLMYKAFIGEEYSFTFFGKLARIFVK